MEKQMYKGDWKCCCCGGSITELPFQPKNVDNLTCRECYASGKNTSKTDDKEKKMFEGNWECGKCGSPIKNLPFQPKSENNLTCIDCFKKSKQN